jgi:Amt family ammonium transporter
LEPSLPAWAAETPAGLNATSSAMTLAQAPSATQKSLKPAAAMCRRCAVATWSTRATTHGCWSPPLLVILMSLPGLALFYGGLVRTKNMLSVLMQVFVLLADRRAVVHLRLLARLHRGHAFFGAARQGVPERCHRPGFAGRHLQQGRRHPRAAFVIFQATFAAITCCLIVGAFAERMKFSAVLSSW